MDLKKRSKTKDETPEYKVPLEPIAVTLKKKDLLSRIYDQGFSPYPMASISRPITDNSHYKPVTTTLYSLSNKMTKPKKQTQNSILFNVPEQSYLNPHEEDMLKSKHSAFMHTTSMFYGKQKRLVQGDGQRADPHHIHIHEENFNDHNEPIPKNPNFGQTSNSNAFAIPGMGNTKKSTGMASNLKTGNMRTYSNSKGFKQTEITGQDGPFGAVHEQRDTIEGSQTGFKTFYHTHKEATGIHGAEKLKEIENARHVINKLRGAEDRAANLSLGEKSKGETAGRKEDPDGAAKMETEEASQEAGARKDSPVHKVTELDIYIELIIKNSSTLDEFMYLKPDPESDNPYKLELTNYNEIDDNSEYYTISGKGFSHYKNGQPIEFIPLKDWLDERETFKKIQSLQFFQKFRKWKTLKRWRKSCQKYKRDKYKANLSQKLFISNDFLRESLFKHRVLCFNMSQEKFIELKNPGDTNDAINLNDFAMMQASKKKHVHEKIKRYSDECRKIVKEGFTKNLDHLRNEVFVKKGNENITRPESTNLIRIKENAYEGLGFTNDMSYDQRSQVRNVCVNFLRFSFLIDFLALDALSTIYIRSVLELREKFESLAHLEGERILTDLEKGKNLFRGKLPMFKIDIEFCENSPNEPEEIEDVEVKFFDMPEAQEADPALFRDYNMKAHPFLIDFSGLKDNEKIQKRQVEEFDDSKKFRQQKVTNIEKMWLNLNPNMGRFIAEIKKIFPDGINALSSFERWSKHPDTVPYSAILEEWDDQIGKDSEGLDSNYLNPDHWINEDFKSSNTDAIQKLLETAFSRSSGYLEQFKEYLQVYWEYKNLDVDMLINENLAKPRITFRSIFKLLEYHKMTFELKIPFQADIGLMRIASEALKTELKVKPDDMRKIIEEKLPVELRKRCDNLKEWFDECAKEVSKQNDGDIEQFILQRKVLEQTEQYFPLIKERIKVVEDLYKVLKDFVVDVPKNDYALFMDIKTKDSNLNTELNNKTNELSKQQEQQIKILNNEMIKKLFDDIRDLSELVKDGLYLDSELDEETTIIELNEHYSKVLAFKKKCTDYNSYQIAFGTDKTDFEAVRTLETTVKAKKILWESLRDWDALVKKYEETLFKFIDHKTIKAEADKQSMNVSIIRRSIDTNNILLKKLDSNIKSFGKTMPVVVALKNELLTKVDHEKIRNLIGQEQLDLETIRLKDLIDMEIFNFQNEIVKISTQVTQEYELGLQLDALDREWEQAKFDLIVYKDQKEQVYVLTKIPDTVAKIDKLLAGINSIYANRYLDKLKDRVAKRRDDTLMISTLLDEWIRFQAQWIYLERIFSTPEFKKELKEVGTFEKINVEYRKQSRTVFNKNSGLLSKNIMELKTKVLPMLESSNKTLHVINKSINDFLDFKRSKIRRLHFISNDEMIILLAKSSEIDEVNKYIGKLFENVNKLKLGEKVTNYEGVLSREGEQLTFPNNFHLSISERGLDIWMDELEKNIRDAITKDLKQAYEKIFESETREEFYRTKLMSQAMTVANQVYWTYNTKLNIEEQKENPESLWTWYKDIEKNIQLMTDLVRSGELEGYRHVTICSIVTGEVHNRDVVYALVEKGVSSVADFAWEQQLRYELVDTSGGGGDKTKENQLLIRQINASFRYGFEYIGPTTRIVITPLTDKCWITITSALNIGLGSAPAGPAGTGKTESTKDLAKALGRMCIVYNCSEQVEVLLIERYFRGVIYLGAWTCLDEFNRIDIEVLSVIAQQVLEIKNQMVKTLNLYRVNKQTTDDDFLFVGKACSLSINSGIFITMNPGYAGRTELPDNLKVLFRPVAMMIPDYAMIAEILLLSEGFSQSKDLSEKMKNLYKLSSEQLSQQKHYDFGMRAVKSVLEMAGKLKRENGSVPEDLLLIQAMRDSNVPKFLEEDLKLFNALIQDLFPTANIKDIEDEELTNSIIDMLRLQELEHENVKGFRHKTKQLYDIINVRFGVTMVGGAMVGKSSVIKTLAMALSNLKNMKSKNPKVFNIERVILSPKSISMGELFGEENKFTKDWTDGLASHYIRKATMSEDKDLQIWIIFDGPVDANWIENLNSVLDDSRLLCLANGQRIRLGNNIRMLFEVGDLKEASPATVSRLGVVYMDPKDLGWRPMVKNWIKNFVEKWVNEDKVPVLDKEIVEMLTSLMEDNIEEFYSKTRFSPLDEPIEVIGLQRVRQVCNYMEMYLSEENGFKLNDRIENKERIMRHALMLSLAWGFGGSVFDSARDKLNTTLKNKFLLHYIEDNVYNLYLNYEEQALKPWSELMPEYAFEDKPLFHEILIPTVDTVKIGSIMEKMFTNQKNVFLTGSGGVGKSVLTYGLLKEKKNQNKFTPLNFIFSAKTSSNETQETILNNLHVESKYVRSSKPGMRNIVVIDDINMPEIEASGAQPPIELLRQLADLGFLYEKKELNLISINRTQLLGIGGPPSGGRNKLSTRFTRHFNVICQPEPDAKNLKLIFTQILRHFYEEYSKKVQDSIESIVDCTISIYQKIKTEKLPIPAKFHYSFNLRDLSNIFKGLTSSNDRKIKESATLVRLWIHESSRILHDRLINEKDKSWFYDSIIKLLQDKLQIKWEKDDLFVKNPIRFSNVMIPDEANNYEDLKNVKDIVKKLKDYQFDYNDDSNTSTKLKLVFFDEAVDHGLRILRILNTLRGNGMLIGIGGLGKQSLTRFISHVLRYAVKELEVPRNFTVANFKEWLRKNIILPCAGPDSGKTGRPTTFLIIDNQITNDSILEIINNLLNSGEIPNLFPQDERDGLINGMRELVTKQNENLEPAAVYKRFTERIRDNLHIIMCMSPIGDGLRVKCRQFPALTDCCTLDWYSTWPHEALYTVASNLMENSEDLDQNEIPRVCRIFQQFQIDASETANTFMSLTSRRMYLTPKTLLDLVNLFKQLIEKKRSQSAESISILKRGSLRLAETKEVVAELDIQITNMKPILEEKSKIAAEKSIHLEGLTKISMEKKEICAREAEEIQIKNEEVKVLSDKANGQLEIEMPKIEQAKIKIMAMSKEDLGKIKVSPKPSESIQKILECVCNCFNIEWGTSIPKIQAVYSELIPNPDKFKKRLVDHFDKVIREGESSMSSKKVEETKKILIEIDKARSGKENEKFIGDEVLVWVKRIIVLYELKVKIAPLEKNVREMNELVRKSQLEYDKIEAEFQKVQEESEMYQREFDKIKAEKDKLEDTINKDNIRLDRAKKLGGLLKDEEIRWKNSVKDLEIESKCIIGNVILSSGSIIYFGPLTEKYRTQLKTKWMEVIKENGILISPNYNLIEDMGDRLELREWYNNGLPTDDVSTENAIIAMNGFNWPLMIDPQLQANKWIKNVLLAKKVAVVEEKKKDEDDEDASEKSYMYQEDKNDKEVFEPGLKLVKLDMEEKKLLMILRIAIMNGYPVLLEDAGETIAHLIEPLVSKTIVFDQIEGRSRIKFNDEDIDYHPDFKLFMTTKISNPKYLPNIFIKTNVINFSVTIQGLEDQLLGDVVMIEDPELEIRKNDNLEKLSQFRKVLALQEKDILKQLCDSTVSPVDSQDLVDNLSNSKTLSKEIETKAKASEISNLEINKTREKFRPVATRGSILYFVIDDISKIDPMYQYSLQMIKNLFLFAIKSTPKDLSEEDQRNNRLTDAITKTIYTNVSRGLFEEHKFIFSALICVKVLIQMDKLDPRLWNIFLRGAPVFDSDSQPPNPDPKNITRFNWDIAYYLDTNYNQFNGICHDISTHINSYIDFAKELEPFVSPLPDKCRFAKLDIKDFEKILLIRILKQEKIMYSMAKFVEKFMGSYYVGSLEVKMKDIHGDSSNKKPIIFILSQGADPRSLIEKLGDELGFRFSDSKLLPISLGQGQGKYAEEIIRRAMKEGKWALLENCHLSKSWMPDLEKLVEKIQEDPNEFIHEDFRLFLTSMPASYFPVTILQNGLKVTTEPPRGIRANMIRSLNNYEDAFLDGVPLRDAMHRINLGLCFFHAIVQERRKFGSLGWNKKYEFNDSDLETSKKVLENLMREIKDEKQIPWDTMLFLTGIINYGGRVTDDHDKRLLMTLISRFYKEDILDTKFTFCDNEDYMIPRVENLSAYKAYASGLELNDDPSVFGMHQNANVTYQAQETDKLIATIMNINPNVLSGGDEGATDRFVTEFCEKLLSPEEGIPALIKFDEVKFELNVLSDKGLKPSLTTVLYQEADRFNILLTVARDSLEKLKAAIDGTAIMSATLDNVYKSMLDNVVPKVWTENAYPCLMPLTSWVRDLIKRVKFFQKWVKEGNPTDFWLPGFFFPQGLLTGILQTFSRQHAVAIDKLAFDFRVVDTEKMNTDLPPEGGGVYISGLFMEGARWDKRRKSLADQEFGAMFDPMPMIGFVPYEIKELSLKEQKKLPKPVQTYQCPLYMTTLRAGELKTTGQSTNYIISVNLPTLDATPDIWVLRGTALFCQLKD